VPALLRKFHEAHLGNAPEVTLWGTGSPRREFLHVHDLAEAAILLMREYDHAEIINVGMGEDISIRELAELIAEIVGYHGRLRFNSSKPDGTPRKLLNVDRMRELGWRAQTSLRDGIAKAYADFLKKTGA